MKAGFIKAVFILLILLSPLKAWAVDKLTEENIHGFYQAGKDAFESQDVMKRVENIKTHFHPDFVIINIYPVAANDGTLSQTIEKKRNKQQIINQLLNIPQPKMRRTEYEILSISINTDQKSALVKDRKKSFFEKHNTVITEECDDEILLTPEGVIQIYQSTCRWVVPEEFKKKQPQ